MGKSLALDRAILRAHRLPKTTRGAFVLRKYAALVRIATGRPATIKVPGLRFTARSASEVGTLQSAIMDVHDDLVVPSLYTGRGAVIDVGANAGQFTAAVKVFFPDARVESVEPDPVVYGRLVSNVGHTDGVTCWNVGLSESRATLPFHRKALSVTSSFFADESGDGETINVPVERLDDLFAVVDDIELVKIDVEGFERQVMLGGIATLGRTSSLLFELSLDPWLGGPGDVRRRA